MLSYQVENEPTVESPMLALKLVDGKMTGEKLVASKVTSLYDEEI